MINFRNPITIFISLWVLVLFLYQQMFCLVLLPLDSRIIWYVFFTFIVFIVSYLVVKVYFRGVNLNNGMIFQDNFPINTNLKFLFWFWAFFSLYECIHFGGFPLMFLLGISHGGVAYTHYGIPSLHGFLNAMIIVISNYVFYFFLKKKEKKYLFYFLLCLLWPIILVTRQMLMSMVIQAAFIFLLTTRVNKKMLKRTFLLGFVVVVVFGILGDLRSQYFEEVVKPSSSYPKWLPSGFLWVYAYMTTPLNNLNYNANTFALFNFNLSPFLTLFPSAFRKYVYDLLPASTVQFKLVNSNLNVTTFFPKYLQAFGYIGSLFFFFFQGITFSSIYLKYKEKFANVKWVFVLAILMHNIICSVFADFFFSLVFIFQIFLHFMVAYTYKLRQ